jgi:hypothetical protein
VDYVIAGLALGSALAMTGFVLRELGSSRRLPGPRWFVDAGIALMIAGLITWVLTAGAIVSNQDDDTAAMIVGAGAAVASAGALIALLLSGRARRRSHRESASLRVVARPAVVEPAASEDAGVRIETASFQHAAASVESGEPPAMDARDGKPDDESGAVKDWEAIWRQTWGSGVFAAVAAADETPPIEAERDPARETWSADTAIVEASADEAVQEQSSTNDDETGSVQAGAEHRDEKDAIPAPPDPQASSSNGAAPVVPQDDQDTTNDALVESRVD